MAKLRVRSAQRGPVCRARGLQHARCSSHHPPACPPALAGAALGRHMHPSHEAQSSSGPATTAAALPLPHPPADPTPPLRKVRKSSMLDHSQAYKAIQEDENEIAEIVVVSPCRRAGGRTRAAISAPTDPRDHPHTAGPAAAWAPPPVDALHMRLLSCVRAAGGLLARWRCRQPSAGTAAPPPPSLPPLPAPRAVLRCASRRAAPS